MSSINQRVWDAMGFMILVTLILFNISLYKDILCYQTSLDERIKEFPIQNFEDTRSLEHRYFELLHKTYKSGNIEKSEEEYYNHLKKFYKIPVIIKRKPEIINDMLLFGTTAVYQYGEALWKIEYTEDR
jgi:hypothetical protein